MQRLRSVSDAGISSHGVLLSQPSCGDSVTRFDPDLVTRPQAFAATSNNRKEAARRHSAINRCAAKCCIDNYHENFLPCLLLIVVASFGVKASTNSVSLPTLIPFTGACDGVTDGGPAIQAAFENITAPGGSHNLVLPASGDCRIATPVTNTFDNTHDIIVTGSGSGGNMGQE